MTSVNFTIKINKIANYVFNIKILELILVNKKLYMKLTHLLFSFFISGVVICQSIRVKESNMNTSKGSQNSLSIEIPFVEEEFFQDELKSYLKDWGKCKESKGEYCVLLGEWKDYGKKPFDVYVRYEAKKDAPVSVSFAIDLTGAFLNSKDHSSQFELFKKSIESFGRTCASNYISSLLEKENKTLKNLEKEQKELEEDKSDLEKEIEDYRKRIDDNLKKIEENNANQEKKKDAIKTQTGKVQEIEKKKKDIF
jgi:molecular chaperone DnaK (HSP70)